MPKRPNAPVPTTSYNRPEPNTPLNTKTTIDSPMVDSIAKSPFKGGKGK
jgi:hypothetical protein